MKKYIYLLGVAFIPLILNAQNKTTKSNAIPVTHFWSLTGNHNINDTSDFLGTTDQHRLTFKVNNNKSGFIDFDSLQSNTAFGYQTLVSLSPFGINNTAFGYQALNQISFGSDNLAVGVRALYSNNFGQSNLAIGNTALLTNNGSYNLAIGSGTLTSNIGGGNNIGIGFNALFNNQYSSDNVAIGLDALYYNTASENTAAGSSAMYNNSTGAYNVTIGSLSLYNNTIGGDNTAAGATALFNNTTGYYNTAFGMQALIANQTGQRNTAVGALANVTESNLTNSTAIGFNAQVDASFKVVIGNAFVKSIGGAVGWTNYSDERIKQNVKENVPGLVFINQLKPVTYHFNTKKEEELLGKKDSLNEAADSKIESIQFTGLLAQDVDRAAKNVNYDFSGIDKSGKLMGLRYSEFVVPLVKAVQELSHKNDSLQTADDQLQQQLTALQSRIEKLESVAYNNQSQNAQAAVASLSSSATLNQNIPNPFKSSTVISYSLPAYSNNAYLNVYSTAGTLIKSIQLSAAKGSVTLQSSDLSAGTYHYNLFVNNKIIGGKQMIVIK